MKNIKNTYTYHAPEILKVCKLQQFQQKFLYHFSSETKKTVQFLKESKNKIVT